MDKGCQPVWLSKFIAPIYSVRELLWFLPKLANFPEIWDTDYRGINDLGFFF